MYFVSAELELLAQSVGNIKRKLAKPEAKEWLEGQHAGVYAVLANTMKSVVYQIFYMP